LFDLVGARLALVGVEMNHQDDVEHLESVGGGGGSPRASSGVSATPGRRRLRLQLWFYEKMLLVQGRNSPNFKHDIILN
jgi:hypothetical protein